MNKTIEEATTTNTTLTVEQISTTLEAVAEKVQAYIDSDKEVLVEISGCMYVESCCIEFDGALRIQFAGMLSAHEFDPNHLLSIDGLEEEYIICLTLHFDCFTVEIECDD